MDKAEVIDKLDRQLELMNRDELIRALGNWFSTDDLVEFHEFLISEGYL